MDIEIAKNSLKFDKSTFKILRRGNSEEWDVTSFVHCLPTHHFLFRRHSHQKMFVRLILLDVIEMNLWVICHVRKLM